MVYKILKKTLQAQKDTSGSLKSVIRKSLLAHVFQLLVSQGFFFFPLFLTLFPIFLSIRGPWCSSWGSAIELCTETGTEVAGSTKINGQNIFDL
jgi:hypothetical protein